MVVTQFSPIFTELQWIFYREVYGTGVGEGSKTREGEWKERAGGEGGGGGGGGGPMKGYK